MLWFVYIYTECFFWVLKNVVAHIILTCPRAVQHRAVCVCVCYKLNLCMLFGSLGWFIRMWRRRGSDKTTESTTPLFQLVNYNSIWLWDIHCHVATVHHELCIIDTFTAVGLFDSVLYLIPLPFASFKDRVVKPNHFAAASLLCRALKYDLNAC